MSNPSLPDLLKDNSEPLGTDNEFFLVTILDLELDTPYPLEFAWKYKDGTISEDWSSVYKITTLAEPAPNPPLFQVSDLANDGASLVVRWTGVDNTNQPYPINFDRVEIFAKGGSFGETYVNTGYVFREAGTKVISVSTGATYYVKLRAVTKRGTVSGFSTERSATTVAQLIADIIAPNAPVSGSVTAGIDNSSGATIGFNAYLDISWSSVNDLTLRGYRIRFRRNGSSDPYSYVDSPGTGTTFRLTGLAIGTTYEVAIASYDELNNTSSTYTSIGTATATGTPFIGKNITTVGYFGASATGETGEFRFGYGVETGRRGLRFDSNNYWYIDASAAASFRLGGPSNNYLQWDGSTFTIDGNITARGGSFSGNVAMTTTGASIYNGTLNEAGALAAGTTGFMLNKDGLQFKYLGSEKITLRASDGKIIATDAEISGSITSSSISSSSISTSTSGGNGYIYITSGTGNASGTLSFYDPNGNLGAITSFSTGRLNIYAPGEFAGGAISMSFNGTSSENPGTISLGYQMRNTVDRNLTSDDGTSQFFRNIGITSTNYNAEGTAFGFHGSVLLIWE